MSKKPELTLQDFTQALGQIVDVLQSAGLKDRLVFRCGGSAIQDHKGSSQFYAAEPIDEAIDRINRILSELPPREQWGSATIGALPVKGSSEHDSANPNEGQSLEEHIYELRQGDNTVVTFRSVASQYHAVNQARRVAEAMKSDGPVELVMITRHSIARFG